MGRGRPTFLLCAKTRGGKEDWLQHSQIPPCRMQRQQVMVEAPDFFSRSAIKSDSLGYSLSNWHRLKTQYGCFPLATQHWHCPSVWGKCLPAVCPRLLSLLCPLFVLPIFQYQGFSFRADSIQHSSSKSSFCLCEPESVSAVCNQETDWYIVHSLNGTEIPCIIPLTDCPGIFPATGSTPHPKAGVSLLD